MTHTPTPWYVEQIDKAEDYLIVNDSSMIGQFMKKEDAEYIVLAVNAHETLVKALKTAREQCRLIVSVGSDDYKISREVMEIIDEALERVK